MADYQKIYNLLRGSGLSEAGALGLMGNWDCESNCEACRVQGDFTSDRSTSKRYAANVNSGSTSRNTFMNDQKGWGLAQWTYFTRKGSLYDYAKYLGTGIESVDCQVQFAIRELTTDYAGLFAFLKSTDDLYAACTRVCTQYERPAYNNIDARYASAQRIKGQINLGGGESTPTPDPEPVEPNPATPEPIEDDNAAVPGWALIPATEFWPPRGSVGGVNDPGLCKGMKGKDVEVLCAILKAREWDVNYVSDEFGSFLEEKVRAFQTAYGLAADGIVGPMTWGKLFERT